METKHADLSGPAGHGSGRGGAEPGPGRARSAPGGTNSARLGVFLLLALIFAGGASIFGPFASRARPIANGAAPDENGVPLGAAIGRDYRLSAHATADGVRYTVTSARGRILASDLAAEDVYRMFPDLDPGALHTGPDDVGGHINFDPDR